MNTAIKKRIRKTKNANVRDRLRLVGDVQEGMSITGAAKKLGMSQPWGSKWWARYRAEGFDGLEDRPRSGRPPKVARDMIDGAVTRSTTWTSDGLLDHIEQETGVRHCPGYGGILLEWRGYSLKVAVRRHAGRAPLEEMETFQRRIRRRIRRCQKKGIPVPVQDEAIFVADASPGRVYTPHGIRAVCHVSGTHDRTIVYGVPGLDGEQLFRQYGKFNGDTLAEYLKEVKKEFDRALVTVDRAPQHRAGIAGGTLRGIAGIRPAFLPAASPELSAVEECWRQSKRDLLGVSYVTMGRLRQTIDEYFANKSFGLDILRYLTRYLWGGAAPPKCARAGKAALGIPLEWKNGSTPCGTVAKSVPYQARTARQCRPRVSFLSHFVWSGSFGWLYVVLVH